MSTNKGLGSTRDDEQVISSRSTSQASAQSGYKPVQAVIFDLDGTLVDTARDFVRIIQQMCREAGIEAPGESQIRHQVSAGAAAMVKLFADQMPPAASSSLTPVPTLKSAPHDPVGALVAEFVRRYAEQICVDSVVYTGGDLLIEQLKKRGVKLGIVTNKPKFLTQRLVAGLELDRDFTVILSPEDVTHPKPHPESLVLAAQRLGVPVDQAWYIGDHERDIEAGRRAGMTTVVARYGYIDSEAPANLIDLWQADHQIESLSGLADLLKRYMPRLGEA